MDKKLKILVLSDYSFTKGGAERVAITTAIGLAERGHEVVFFSAAGPVSDELADAGLKKVICLGQKDILDNPSRVNAMFAGIYNRKAVKELKILLKKWKPDIAHLHGLSKALSWAPVNVLHAFKIPMIYTLHDYGLICPNLGIFDFKSDRNCLYYKPGQTLRCLVTDCDKRNYLQKVWRWTRFQTVKGIYRISKKVDGYIAVSNFINIMIKDNLRPRQYIRTIYNPIEKGKKITGSRTGNKRKNFLYVGRLSREKGIDLLLKAIVKVDADLTIIGDGELAADVRDVQNRSGGKKINFMGYQGKEVIYGQMRRSIALVLPSRCMEPAPLVIGEAAYNHLPSVVADHGGLTEFVIDGVNGIHFKAGDVDSLIRSMDYFVSRPEKTEELGMKAYDIINALGLDLDNHLDKVLKYYFDILHNK